jgi:protein translocase SecG subunit
MLKLFLVFLSIFLIPIILFRVPQQDAGLSSFATKNSFLGSPGKAQKFLNILTAFAILLYLVLAIFSNLSN